MSNIEQQDDADTSVPHDFVYAGRVLRGKDVYGRIFLIVDGEIRSSADVYAIKVLKGKTVGGVYRGARFHDGGSKGLAAAGWVRAWPDTMAVVGWRAADDQVATKIRIQKDERDSKKANELESLLLPLRKLYASYSSRHDYAGKEALEAAVLRALRAAPRKTEL